MYDYDPTYRGAQFVGNMIPNVPSNRSDVFHNIEVTLSKRPGGKWFANTSLLATKNHRWIEAIVETPNSNYFPLDETWTVSYRLAGGYRLPYRLFRVRRRSRCGVIGSGPRVCRPGVS
jgi:hypothetical protein